MIDLLAILPARRLGGGTSYFMKDSKEEVLPPRSWETPAGQSQKRHRGIVLCSTTILAFPAVETVAERLSIN